MKHQSKKLKKTKRIMFIAKSIDGGTGTFLLNLLQLDNYNIQTTTLILEKPTFRTIKDKRFMYLRKKRSYPDNYSLSFINVKNLIAELLWLKKQISIFNPDVILGVDLRCNLLSIMSKLIFFSPAKIIVTSHINLTETLAAKATPLVRLILYKLIGMLYDRADAHVAVSKKLSKSLTKEFGLKNKVTTIYNGASFKTVSPKNINKSKKIVFISVGRLDAQKDFETVIDAFDITQKMLRNSKLAIVGDGPDKTRLISYINKHSLSKKIKLTGWSNEIGKYLRQANVFILSSKREGFAYVLLEAMSVGLPVISTNTPFGPEEILNNGEYGMLVPMYNAYEMSKSMLKITNSQIYRRYSKKSLKRSKFFSAEKMLTGYKNVIEQIS